MSDDHDDYDDERGGLWDPDAFTPAPAPARPALHIVTTQDTADRLDRRADTAGTFEGATDHTLVRLEQFRHVGDMTRRPRNQTKPALARRAALVTVLAMVVAAAAGGYTLLSPTERPSQPAPSQRLGGLVAPDSERAAATRTVASTRSSDHNDRQPTSRSRRHAKAPRRPVTRSRKQSATSAQHAPTTAASRAPTTSGTTIARPAAPSPHPQASAATANSEFGFEG
jgi:hypothetical protein